MGKLGWAKGNGHKGRNGLDNLMPTTRPKFDLNYIAGVNQKILQVLESKKHKYKVKNVGNIHSINIIM